MRRQSHSLARRQSVFFSRSNVIDVCLCEGWNCGATRGIVCILYIGSLYRSILVFWGTHRLEGNESEFVCSYHVVRGTYTCYFEEKCTTWLQSGTIWNCSWEMFHRLVSEQSTAIVYVCGEFNSFWHWCGCNFPTGGHVYHQAAIVVSHSLSMMTFALTVCENCFLSFHRRYLPTTRFDYSHCLRAEVSEFPRRHFRWGVTTRV